MRHLMKFVGASLIRYNFHRFPRRTYLSDAFACTDTWESRLNHRILQQVNSEIMYYELDAAYNKTRKLTAVDVDVFVNAQKDDTFLTEVEEFVYKLRLTKQTCLTLPTTHHAVIRLFLQCRRYDDLVRILNDRLNYGIFPDYYCSMLLLDQLLKVGDLRNAAKVGALDMFQEDYSHDIVKYMSLLAIHKYILTDQLWDDPLPEPVQNEDDEEIKVRVKFLRNPYFDNHFDLVDGNLICGKSLLMISSKLEGSLRQSYKLMGLALFNLWDKLEEELVDLIGHIKNQAEPILFSEALEFARNHVKNHLKDAEKLDKISELFSQIDLKACNQGNLLLNVENELKKHIENHEKDEIQNQEKLYKDWETLRENTLAEYLDEMSKRKRLEEVNKKKQELLEKEQLYSYFDNEDVIEKVVQDKREKIRKRVWYRSDEMTEEEYIPPEVKQRSETKTNQ